MCTERECTHVDSKCRSDGVKKYFQAFCKLKAFCRHCGRKRDHVRASICSRATGVSWYFSMGFPQYTLATLIGSNVRGLKVFESHSWCWSWRTIQNIKTFRSKRLQYVGGKHWNLVSCMPCFKNRVLDLPISRRRHAFRKSWPAAGTGRLFLPNPHDRETYLRPPRAEWSSAAGGSGGRTHTPKKSLQPAKSIARCAMRVCWQKGRRIFTTNLLVFEGLPQPRL